jgi:hypothetical protein
MVTIHEKNHILSVVRKNIVAGSFSIFQPGHENELFRAG